MQQTPIIDEATAQVGNGTLYTIQPIPGKGHGLIATTTILKGTRILSELPLFKISYKESNRQVLTDHIAKALKDVDETKQRAFLDLQNVYGLDDGPLLGIARSNVKPLGSGAPEGGLFLDAARINHSCRPNVQNTWNANIGRLTVHAVRDIEQGEEITVSYLGVTMLYDERQIILKRRFGFDCGCGLCSVPLAQRYESDARIESVRQCEPWLAIYLSGFPIGYPMDYAGALVFAFGMLEELKAEGACDARFPGVYHHAFKVAIKNGDKTRAKIFAERAYAARVLVEGDDSPEAARLAQYVQQPTQHPLYQPRATDVILPQGLSKSKFEKWLWKQHPDVSEEGDPDDDDL